MAIIPYFTAGFISCLRSNRIVKGTGKIHIQPNTHSQVLLFLSGCWYWLTGCWYWWGSSWYWLKGCWYWYSLSGYHVYPQSLQKPTVWWIILFELACLISPWFSLLNWTLELLHLGQPALLILSCASRISAVICEPQKGHILLLYISPPQLGHFTVLSPPQFYHYSGIKKYKLHTYSIFYYYNTNIS